VTIADTSPTSMTVTSGATYHHFPLNFHLQVARREPTLVRIKKVPNDARIQSVTIVSLDICRDYCTLRKETDEDIGLVGDTAGTYQRDIDDLVPLFVQCDGTCGVPHVQNTIYPSDRAVTNH
jgi:hypothetical protein